MLWGYAGVFPGAFCHYDDDRTLNRLRFAAAHGFRSTGISLRELDDADRYRQVAALVEHHDLRLSVHVGARWFADSEEDIHRGLERFSVELCRHRDALRVAIVTMAVGPYHRFMRDPPLEQQMDRLGRVLPPLAAACHELGSPLGIENHGDYYLSDLVSLCERVPHLGIFLDTGNTYLIGEPPLPACKLAAPYAIGTHFKDHHVHPDPKTLTFVIEGAALGEGDVRLRDVYQALLDHHSEPRRLVMQWELVPPKNEDPYAVLERSWEFIHSLPEPAR